MTASLAEQVAWTCRMLALGGQGDFTLGHASARRPDGSVLMKPNRLGLEEVTPGDVLTLDRDGAKLAGDGPVHLEAVLHTAVYRARPDVGAVIHTHPPYATAFGATDARLEFINHDAVLFLDGLAYFDQTAELIMRPDQGETVATALGERNVLIMRGHGVLVVGKTLPWAVYTALTLERVLRIQSIAQSLGSLQPMSPEMARRVYPDKYRDEFLDGYWRYLVRQVRRAGLDAGMPEDAEPGEESRRARSV
ncbi:MAG: class II aldolase/adducin family protein [Thermomicrobiales bacterium]|nr:class II aldolase/adducin family protein [Thermomicrobiales bacterium]